MTDVASLAAFFLIGPVVMWILPTLAYNLIISKIIIYQLTESHLEKWLMRRKKLYSIAYTDIDIIEKGGRELLSGMRLHYSLTLMTRNVLRLTTTGSAWRFIITPPNIHQFKNQLQQKVDKLKNSK